MPVSSHLLRPVRPSLIFLTLLGALMLNLLPWQLAGGHFAPDFVALLLLYWTLNQPRRIGVGWAFLLGVVMDVANSNILGQHALAYSVISYLVLSRQRRINIYPFWQQALVVLGLLLLAQLLMAGLRFAIGSETVGPGYFVSPFVAAFLWVPLSNLLLVYQRTRVPDSI
ncbi:rod shape-determining protein MreD [Chitiniphilus purpureus]|uniref:Rod shape-determining protein MreD n=1 Tax=Chitiniphilus purpureus TaxID=2981137 RepID=A0ABY6DTC8_9NEIS|nr:rod shape-determining protein MreD [Chitiniphilus sp. CD1]UXY15118.1 rod shape-determining protein MreD [Chitiniphilus sp. CD1]